MTDHRAAVLAFAGFAASLIILVLVVPAWTNRYETRRDLRRALVVMERLERLRAAGFDPEDPACPYDIVDGCPVRLDES